MKKETLKSHLDSILTQIEDIPLDFSNRRNIERILAFLDYCYSIEQIREKVITSPKLTYSLIECLDTIDYHQVDSFESIYDVWKICTKYFNIPTLATQPYFEKLKRVIWNKTCLLHAQFFVRIKYLRDSIEKSSNKEEVIAAVIKQINVVFDGEVSMFGETELKKVLAAVFFLRLKLVNMILTFYNILLDSQGEERKTELVIEMNFIPENHNTVGDYDNLYEDHINFSLLTPVLDLLLDNADMFKLWDFTFTISETMFLVQKLVDHSSINNQASKTVYNYLQRIVEKDLETKAKQDIPLRNFGEDDERTKFSKPDNYLKNILRTMEILPTSDNQKLQNENSVVMLLQKIFNSYITNQIIEEEEESTTFFDESMYLSFLVVLSRVEVQLMSMSLIEGVFLQFEKYKEKFPANINSLFQMIFVKRLIIYCYDENDIFEFQTVVSFYNRIFEKFEEYMNMLKTEKVRIKRKKKESQKQVLSAHSIKNAKTIKILEEEIRSLNEEDEEVRSRLV